MRSIFKLYFSIILCLFLSSNAFSAPTHHQVTSKAQQAALTPLQALHKLQQGNTRFVKQKLKHYQYKAIVRHTAKAGQHPLAIIVNCIDSRSIPDILFDQGIGNIFVSRIAGNVIGRNVLGSINYAVMHAGVKLIVVMGHTSCGAVKGACLGIGKANLKHLLSQIQPAVNTIKSKSKKFSCNNKKTLNLISKQNVLDQMQVIMANSPSIANEILKKKVMLVGAMHHLSSGKVDFFNIHGKSI